MHQLSRIEPYARSCPRRAHGSSSIAGLPPHGSRLPWPATCCQGSLAPMTGENRTESHLRVVLCRSAVLLISDLGRAPSLGVFCDVQYCCTACFACLGLRPRLWAVPSTARYAVYLHSQSMKTAHDRGPSSVFRQKNTFGVRSHKNRAGQGRRLITVKSKVMILYLTCTSYKPADRVCRMFGSRCLSQILDSLVQVRTPMACYRFVCQF